LSEIPHDIMVPLHYHVLSALLLFFVVGRSVNAEGCFVPDTTWDANIDQGIANVTTKEQCQDMCSESSSPCLGFTFYNEKASPRGNYCELFPTLYGSTPCTNCVSGPSSCLCSGPYTCSLAGDAVLGLDFGVATEEECAELCWNAEGCNFYSFYSIDSSPLQLACAKLSQCLDRQNDPSVVSGPSDCNDLDLVSESYPMCFNIGQTWQHNDSFTIPNVESAIDCQVRCLQSSYCIAFAWHKESEDFGSKLCELFSSIGETSDCPDCVSGPKSCTCSDSIACSFDNEYLINILTDVASEETCQDLCARDVDCSWYTWYSADAWPFSQACALLSQCSDSKEILDGSVRSGPADCSISKHCSNYNELSSYTRNYLTPDGPLCNGASCCDEANFSHVTADWKGDGWYRVVGQAGSKIIDSPIGYGYCGTDYTGWLSGGHPTSGEGEVTRTVYFDNGGNDKTRETEVKVINCNDAFFVYYLVDVPGGCYLAYCTE